MIVSTTPATTAPDGELLRQHPRFRELVVEQGLLDYWQQWGWSDYCKPDGEDDFRCDLSIRVLDLDRS